MAVMAEYTAPLADVRFVLEHLVDVVLHFEGERMLLRCTSCGHDSPGWEIKKGQRPAVKLAGDPRRHSLGTQPAIVPVRKAS